MLSNIIEVSGEPIKLTLGECTNIKTTTPEDIEVTVSTFSIRDEHQQRK